jgi:ABC-type bacteriocin/lantibiotic exporter with double-glycine peptidase domain
LKGKSGVGKSTLIKLLLGLYTPEEGHVLVANRDSSIIPCITDCISIVPQNPIIFGNKTLKENMSLFTKKDCGDP